MGRDPTGVGGSLAGLTLAALLHQLGEGEPRGEESRRAHQHRGIGTGTLGAR